ncbi:hypothetical protein [Bacillus thuringiensis]|uniref:hypothetical protein n=1 Tax=Bacillus thuringiensis TaxID=1428 RepID=UPI0001A20F01|nr:hypothetical protein [Bacillus thuringiensis]EEM86348.1 hypothetical protein bthur0012_56700 [Bacillus thuringiensis serovar pulsiensis BGSC 4CC1]
MFKGFFPKYERLERELKEFISEEDKNTSWLFSRHENFIKEIKSINELVAVSKQAF